MIIVHFGRFFYAKKTARRKALRRGFTPSRRAVFCGLYRSPFPFSPFSPAFSRNARLAQNPPSAPMSAVGVTSMENMNEISVPTTAPARVGMMMIIAIATIMMSRCPIRMIKSLLKKCFTRDQGLLSPFDKSRKLGSIIQLIVRNVNQIFIRIYILQIAVLIAASGAFGDQIK